MILCLLGVVQSICSQSIDVLQKVYAVWQTQGSQGFGFESAQTPYAISTHTGSTSCFATSTLSCMRQKCMLSKHEVPSCFLTGRIGALAELSSTLCLSSLYRRGATRIWLSRSHVTSCNLVFLSPKISLSPQPSTDE